MSLLLNIALVLAPSVYLVARTAHRDVRTGRDIRTALRATAAGYIAVLPVIALLASATAHTQPLTPLPNALLYSFLAAGLLEEASKLVALRIATRSETDLERVQDGLRYGVLVALGFAFVENLFYISEPLTVVLLRSITALPLHVACAAISGFFLAGSRLEGRGGLALGLASATALHGLYDLALQQPGSLRVLALIPLFGAIALALHLYRRAARIDEFAGRGAQPPRTRSG